MLLVKCDKKLFVSAGKMAAFNVKSSYMSQFLVFEKYFMLTFYTGQANAVETDVAANTWLALSTRS